MAILKTFTLSNEEMGTIDLDNKIAEAALHPFVIKDVVVQHRRLKYKIITTEKLITLTYIVFVQKYAKIVSKLFVKMFVQFFS